MSQNLRANSGKQASRKPGINPKLAASLASLEVQLEQELTRYRRSRIVNRRPHNVPTVVASTENSPGVNSSGVNSSGVNLLKNQVANLAQIKASEANLQENLALNASIQDTEKQDTRKQDTNTKFITTKLSVPPPPPPVESIPSDSISAHTAQTRRVEPQEIPDHYQTDENQGDTQRVEDIPQDITQDTTQDIPQSDSSSIIPAVANLQESENQNTVSGISKQAPNDYLESSEALLRSLNEEKNESSPVETSKGSLLSPLGIIGLILLLLSALGLFVYAAVNPEKIPQFGITKENQENDPVSDGSTTNVNQPEITPIPKNPNLAAKEFPTIEEPNDLVGLKTKAEATAKPSPPPVLPPSAAGESIQPPVIPENAPSNQKPQTPEEVIQSDEDIKPSADGLYRIIIDNEGNQAYAKARSVVPDAYVSDDKKFIYLGALRTKERAKKLLSELEAKGIKARIQ
ncbi:MAG: hypothetical protein AAF208_09035 [Cyanobacteria bacterium P01_A01_bin.45]